MPVDFCCPNCKAVTLVDDQFVGKTGHCASCGHTITVPATLSPPAGDQPAKSYSQSSRSNPRLAILAAIVAGGILVAIMVLAVTIKHIAPTLRSIQRQARHAQCDNNLRQIGTAMHAYHADYGCFPPAYIPDPDGKPMHSWRVLLLPYMDEQNLYGQYDFSQSWDSSVNMALVTAMPQVYGCPYDRDTELGETSYQLIVGPGTLFENEKSMKIDGITGNPSETILVIEVARSTVPWLKPSDLDCDKISFQIDNGKAGEIGSNHPLRGANSLMADGKVRFLDSRLSAQSVRNMASPNSSP